jgi:hypothetical protein
MPNYVQLWSVIDTTGLHFDGRYLEEERTILQPQLEKLGYYNIVWQEGETDSFSPLTRVCKAVNPAGEIVHFVYG